MRLNAKWAILLNAVPVFVMILLIPVVVDDYILTGIYFMVIATALAVKHERGDLLFLGFGLLVMLFSEWFFISTGVETFQRRSLLGVMPLWLPLLWAYAFVAIRRAIKILDGVG